MSRASRRARQGLATVVATALTLVLGAQGTAAAGEGAGRDRMAVVIGNQDYASVADLDNALNDAARMAEMLRGLGFTVFDAYDVDRKGFEALLRKALLNADDDTEIVFFYAGHGIQIGRRNYLLPTDVAFKSIYDLPVESVTLDRVIELLSTKGTVHVAIIDACRDNPFPDVMLAGNLDASLFETKSGFEVFRTPLNSLVAFSTSPGLVALDGEGENSPYTSAIISVLTETPEQEAQGVFARVREKVFAATNGRQVPWESSTLVTPFRFAPEAPVVGRGLQLAQADATDPTPGTTRTTETAPPVQPTSAILPEAVTLNVGYDRRIDLGPALSAALDMREAFEVTIAAPPANGSVAADANAGLIYAPVIAERRATVLDTVLEDAFTLEVEQGDRRAQVQVTLSMAVNGCDLAAGDALDSGGVGFFRLPNEIEILPALELCREAAAQHPMTPRFRYQLGRAEQAAARFEAALQSYRAAAEAGHVRALHGAARLLSSEHINRDVVKVPLDIEAANALYEQGIAAGDPFAIHSRGLMLLRHGATPAERERGFELLDRSAELGHTYSMNELGVYFLNEKSENFLPERGMRYLQASAERQDIYGIHNLGFVALFGLDGPVDHPAAFELFRQAAQGGHPKSPAALGRMIVNGQVTGHAMTEALEWYDIGLARGDGWGGANGANMILNGEVSGHDLFEAYIRAAKAVHLPDGDAAEAARTVLEQAAKRDLAKAVQGLLNELGGELAVDGAIGPATRRALSARAAEHGLAAPPNDPFQQLLTAAQVYWAERPTRPDLF